jgi:hypothetical protein
MLKYFNVLDTRRGATPPSKVGVSKQSVYNLHKYIYDYEVRKNPLLQIKTILIL